MKLKFMDKDIINCIHPRRGIEHKQLLYKISKIEKAIHSRLKKVSSSL